MQKRIVILGGVGFIGTHLCLRLLEEGHEVFCVDIRDAVNSPLLRSVLQHPLFRYVHHNIINTFGMGDVFRATIDKEINSDGFYEIHSCLLYTSPSPRDTR